LSQSGYSCLELKSLPRTFPPTTGSGYTLLLWLRFDELDPRASIPLVTLRDASHRCFVRVSLQPESGTLSFSSSLNKDVSFPGYTFRAGRWYHVAFTHSRPRVSSSAPVTLFVDGVRVAVETALWPSPPVSGFPVELTIGTAKEDAQLDGTTSKWSVGPCWMLDGDLGEDMIFVRLSDWNILSPRHVNYFFHT
jgi:hypothetical protein